MPALFPQVPAADAAAVGARARRSRRLHLLQHRHPRARRTPAFSSACLRDGSRGSELFSFVCCCGGWRVWSRLRRRRSMQTGERRPGEATYGWTGRWRGCGRRCGRSSGMRRNGRRRRCRGTSRSSRSCSAVSRSCFSSCETRTRWVQGRSRATSLIPVAVGLALSLTGCVGLRVQATSYNSDNLTLESAEKAAVHLLFNDM